MAAAADQLIVGVIGVRTGGAKETPLKLESTGAVSSTVNDSPEACDAVVKLRVSVIP